MDIKTHVKVSALEGRDQDGWLTGPGVEFDLPLPDSMQQLKDNPEMAIRLLEQLLKGKITNKRPTAEVVCSEQFRDQSDAMIEKRDKLGDELNEMRRKWIKQNETLIQSLAQALGGFPWYKDDQKNFPGATEEDGVCTGELVLEDLVDMAISALFEERAKRKELERKWDLEMRGLTMRGVSTVVDDKWEATFRKAYEEDE